MLIFQNMIVTFEYFFEKMVYKKKSGRTVGNLQHWTYWAIEERGNWL